MPNEPKTITPPYLSLVQFKNFCDHLVETGVPKKIDKAVMGRMSGSNQTALISTLRFLGLVADDGTTQPALRELVEAKKVGEVEWQRALRTVVGRAYSSIVPAETDFMQETWTTLVDAFKAAGVKEGQMVEKGLRFFVGAMQEAGVPMSEHIIKAKGRTTSSTPKAPRKAKSARGGAAADADDEVEVDDDDEEPDTPPDGYIDQPVLIPGRKVPALIRFPRDISEAEFAFLEHAVAGVKLYALAGKGGAG
jgi:hypothetical protein